jgi:hypothetical protein
MRHIVRGYKYAVQNFDCVVDEQEIQFIHKEKDENGALMTVRDGTTNEELLLVLIDRLKYLNEKLPSRQTSLAITKLEEALMWLANRTEERRDRGVEGTSKP